MCTLSAKLLGHDYILYKSLPEVMEHNSCLHLVLSSARSPGAGSEESGSNLWLLGPVFAVVLLIVIIVAICFLWRR